MTTIALGQMAGGLGYRPAGVAARHVAAAPQFSAWGDAGRLTVAGVGAPADRSNEVLPDFIPVNSVRETAA